MKTILATILIALAFLTGCQREETWRLTTVYQWPIGEARKCELDGKTHEGHCFPPSAIWDQSIKVWPSFMVSVTFDKPPQFSEDQWAGDAVLGQKPIVCRLDSAVHATCHVE